MLAEPFETRDLVKVKYVQSIRVNRLDDSIELNQEAYIMEILKEFRMEECKPVKTPLALNAKLAKTAENEELPPKEASRQFTLLGYLNPSRPGVLCYLLKPIL